MASKDQNKEIKGIFCASPFRGLIELTALCAFVCLFVIHPVSGKNLGGYQGWLDRMGGGVRELGMGNAASAYEDAMPSAYWNPAILPFPQRPMVAFGGEIRSLQRNGGFAGIQGRVFHNLGLGVGILNRGDYDVPVYDEDENFLASAQPQAFGSYLGLGLKTSRRNAFGVAFQWFHSNMGLTGVADAINSQEGVGGELDLFGTASVNQVGLVNLGWYRIWNKNLRTGVVIRNLGFNEALSARFSYTTIPGNDQSGLESAESDFFPKTLVVAGSYSRNFYGYKWDFHGEILDFQLLDDLISF